MGVIIDVPETTLIADLDRAMDVLLREQLTRHGFEDADVVFETPTKEWAARLTRPTVDLFLYDIKRSEQSSGAPTTLRGPGGTQDRPPPLRLDLLFAITAWAPAVVDEHRLLSQLLAILHSFTALDAVLASRLATPQPFPIQAVVGGGRTDRRSEFWQSVGGHYKPAIDWNVTLAVESGVRAQRGPDVRDTTIITRRNPARKAIAAELHSLGGTVCDEAGFPVVDAWVAVPGLGRVTSTDEDGRFKLPGMPPGDHAVEARDTEGRSAAVNVALPGGVLDLVVAVPAASKAKS